MFSEEERAALIPAKWCHPIVPWEEGSPSPSGPVLTENFLPQTSVSLVEEQLRRYLQQNCDLKMGGAIFTCLFAILFC